MSTQIVEYSKTEAALADLASRYKGVVFDVATRDGMSSAIKGRAELRGYRVALEKTRVELKAPALERARLIDAEAKRITAELVAMEDPIDEAIKAEESRKERERAEREQKERERVADITWKIADVSAIPARLVGQSSETIAAALTELNAFDVESWAAEFTIQAAEAKGKAIATLEQLLAGAKSQEQARADAQARAMAEREELARLRAEQAERDRQEAARLAAQAQRDKEAREALEAEQRAAQAKIDAEAEAARKAREAADREAKAARDKADAEAKAARDAEAARQAEADRAAKEARDAEQARQDAEAARLRAAKEKLDAERRETERLQNELLDGAAMLAKFVERFGKRREFAAVVKAIREYEAKHAEPAAEATK